MMQAQGKRFMSPAACINFHPFAETRSWEKGVLVACGVDWKWERNDIDVNKIATNLMSIGLLGQC
jgi:hypothetical protein